MAKMFKEIKNEIITMIELKRMTRQIGKRKIHTPHHAHWYRCVCVNLLKQENRWMSSIVYYTEVKRKRINWKLKPKKLPKI